MRRTTSGSPIRKGKIRAGALTLLAVAGLSGLLAGCGAGSEFLPPNLPGGGGGTFLITTSTLEDGVINRSYSKAIDTVGGTPPVTSCSIVAGALPGGMGVAPSGSQCILSGTPSASGTFFFTLRADDSSTPVARNDTQDFTLVIRQEYSLTTPAPDPLPTGVEDRAYNFAFTVMTNTVQGPDDVGEAGEFGNGPLSNCVVTGLPAGMTSMVSNLTANSCTVTLGGTPNIGLMAGSMPMAFSLTLEVTDTSIGGSNVPARTATQTAIDLVINPPMAFTLITSDPATTNPCTGGTFNDAFGGGQAPQAVNGRTYGAPSGCDLLFTASGGNTPYTWTNLSGAADPDPFFCVQSGVNGEFFTCNSANGNITTLGNTATNLTVQVQDTANAAVAQGTQSTDVNGHASHVIFVNNALAVVSDLGNTLPPAVQGSPYGEAPGAPATFTATGGTCVATINGSCMFSTAASIGAPGPAFPTTIACAMNASPNANRFSCATSASTITGTPGTYMPTVNVVDVPNDTTPAGAPAMVTVSLDVVAAMMFSLTTDPNVTFVDNTGSAPDAVNSRTYGAPARGDLIFTVTGGRPPFTWTDSSGTPLVPLNCVQETFVDTNDRFRCNTGGVIVANPGGTAADITVSVMDTGSVSVPAATATMDDQGHTSHTINVLSEMNIQVFPTGTTASDAPDGVTGRGYGTPAGGSDLAFNTIGGLAPIAMQPDENTIAGSSAAAGFPADLLCASTMSAETTCTTGASTITDPAGTYPLAVSATDTANDTTPSSVRNQNFNLTINDEIVIDNLFLPNGIVGQPYNVQLTCNQGTGNMLCGGTGNPDNASAQYTWSEVGGPAHADILVGNLTTTNPSTGVYAGTPTTTGANLMPTITVTDDGNAVVPPCANALTCPTFTPTYNVVASMALVDATNNQVDVFTTETGTPVAAGNFVLGAGATPRRVAITPNARHAVVVDPGRSEVDIIDLITGVITVVDAGDGLNSAAGDPVSVAIGPGSSPLSNPDSWVAYVTNPNDGSVDVIDVDPNNLSFGTVIVSATIPAPKDVAVTPTIDPGGGPETRAYVLSGTDDVCAIDAQPGSIGTVLDIDPGVASCTDTSVSTGDTTRIEISSDGGTAIVVKTDGAGEPGGIANVVSLPVSPTSSHRDTGTFSSGSIAAPGCFLPTDIRSRPGIGQQETVYVLCGTDVTTGDLIRILSPSPFAADDPSAEFDVAGTTTLTTGDNPLDIAFDASGELAIVTVPGSGNNIRPLTNGASTPQATVALPNVTGPDGVAMVPNPAQLRIVSGPVPFVTAGNPYYSSFRVLGGVRPYRWSDPTGASFNSMTGVGVGNCTGLTLDPATGILFGTPTMAGTTCGPITVRVTDSTPGSPQSVQQSGFTIAINP
ncbi:MAG TPA: hypothetical protein VNN18_03635 [Candidatus Xenobia bacterium]|nr:hypothetical protein [Candidatus Xenobia bacterium]